MFRASAISVSKDLVKEAESIFCHFIWNGKDKVKGNAVISQVENGGLNQPEIHPIASSRFLLSTTSESTSR